jgi:nucleotide-binding universal stress UspA family protein
MLVSHLLSHGVKITAKNILADDGDVARTLRQYAEQSNVDIIIMGGFAHSRIRQLILGGVTQAMLKSCNVPLFLSH